MQQRAERHGYETHIGQLNGFRRIWDLEILQDCLYTSGPAWEAIRDSG